MPKPRKWKPRKRTTTSAIFFALAFLTRVFTVEISANEDALDGIENTIDLLEKQLNEMTGEQKSSKKGVLLDDGTTANARGGTELMSKELQKKEMAGDPVYAVWEASSRRRSPSRSGQREEGSLEMPRRLLPKCRRQRSSQEEMAGDHVYAV